MVFIASFQGNTINGYVFGDYDPYVTNISPVASDELITHWRIPNRTLGLPGRATALKRLRIYRSVCIVCLRITANTHYCWRTKTGRIQKYNLKGAQLLTNKMGITYLQQ